MAKKVGFPLKMKNGAGVRTLEELRENFDIESVLGYFADGRLVKWLRKYYFDDVADKVEALDKYTDDISKQLCVIIGVEYVECNLTINEANEKLEREKIIKQLLTEEQMNYLATNQDELKELYYNGAKTIYVAFGEFELLGPAPGFGLNSEYIILKETNPNIISIRSMIDDWDWIMKYANQGIAVAQYEVGKYYYYQVYDYGSLPRNDEELGIALNAIKWFEMAVENGYDASSELSNIYSNIVYIYEEGDFSAYSNENVIEFNAKAFKWLKNKVENGNTTFHSLLASMYFYGYGTEKDYVKAAELYRKAAESNDIGAMNQLGVIYENGYGVSPDKKTAEEWYCKARENYKPFSFDMAELLKVAEEEAQKEEAKTKADSPIKKDSFNFNMADLLKAAEEEAKKGL